MKELVLKLSKSNLKERVAAYITSILNVVIINIFIMIILELKKIKDEISTVSRDEDLVMFTTALIAISAVIIVFALWIICIVHKTLFIQRKNFNINLKLAGISSSELSKIYILESIYMQIPVIPIGLILAQILYHIMSMYYEFSTTLISIPIVVLGCVIHVLTVSICILFTIKKLAKFDVVEEMRGSKSADRIKTMSKGERIRFIIGLIMLISVSLLKNKVNLDENITSILQLVAAYLMFDAVLVFIQYIILNLGKKLKKPSLVLAQLNILGYYKKTEPILVTLIVGFMLSIGLNGMFLTCRDISRKTVEQNVYFKDIVVYQRFNKEITQNDLEKLVYETDPQAEVSFSFGLKVDDEEGIKNEITGIDSEYLRTGEKIELVSGENISELVDDENWDGIILPEYFISDNKIGDKYKLIMNGQELEFTIKGRFIANGSRGRYGFVSKTYLQKQLGFNGLVNMIHVKKGSNELLNNLLNYEYSPEIDHVSKEDIANNSYENAIKGTEIFELGAFCVILCALLMLINYFAIVSKQNNLDIARFRAMGMSKAEIRQSYILEILSILIQSSIIGLTFAYIFESVGVKMMLPYIDVVIEPIMPTKYIVIIISLLVIISIFTMLNTIKDSLNNKKYITFLRGRD